MNSHLNNILAKMVQQVAKETEYRVEVISTEHCLQNIDYLNERLKRKETVSETGGDDRIASCD